MTNQYHTPEVDLVDESGWVWNPDSSHPKNKELGYYASYFNDAAYGWYTRENHPLKAQLAGDSRPRWQAAKTVLEIYS